MKVTNQFMKDVNKFVLSIITFIISVILVGYIKDYFDGNIGFTFMISVVVVAALALIIDFIIYFKQKDGTIFKHISIIGFAVVYCIVLFGAKSDLVFGIVFPITIIYLLYFDYKLILKIAIGFSMANIVDVIYFCAVLKHTPGGNEIATSGILLQIVPVVIYMIVLCGTTSISNRNNASRLDGIEEEKTKTAVLLREVLQVVTTVKEDSAKANEHMETLSADVEQTAHALNNIAEGNRANAVSIEQQSAMTTNIQEMILSTKKMTQQMIELSEKSEEAVESGRVSMNNLSNKTQESKGANELLVSSVNQFQNNAKEVKEITEQIFTISSQTNLLALNASIESARAGEAGKGFAVVADEIRKLADETRSLTEAIRNIVNDLQQNAEVAKEMVDKVSEVNDCQYEIIQTAEGQFTSIGETIQTLNDNIQDTSKKIEEVYESNSGIVESICQISATSEEVTATTQQISELGEETAKKAKETQILMDELVASVAAIDKHNQV